MSESQQPPFGGLGTTVDSTNHHLRLSRDGGILPSPVGYVPGRTTRPGPAVLLRENLDGIVERVKSMGLDSDRAIEVLADLVGQLIEAESEPRPALPRDAALPLAEIGHHLKRIADALAPPPPDIVDSVYVARRLGCTTTWIADQARSGDIPQRCIVAGTGRGKPWKFHRRAIDEWVESR